jgi:hypothetical protein
MYSTIKHDNEVSYGINEYVCDSTDDLINLPKCSMGSTALIITTSEVYMKNSSGEWVKL